MKRTSSKFSRAAYRVLLFVFPRDFRTEFGDDMTDTFEAQRNERAQHSGRLGIVSLWVETLTDCLRTGPREHWEILWEDLRYAVRGLAKAPSFTIVTLAILALGIGLNALVFGIVDSVLLSPLPYAEPERLVQIYETNEELSLFRDPPSPGNVLDWQELSESFEAIASWYSDSATLLGEPEAQEVPIARVTADFFRVFGTTPVHGRDFLPEEVEGEEKIVMMSHGLFERRYGGDSDVIDDTIRLGQESYRVVGVMPRDFDVPDRETGLWLPYDYRKTYARSTGEPPRDYRFLNVAGRLRRGGVASDAENELKLIAASLAETYPETNRGWSVRVLPLHAEVVRPARGALLLMWTGVALVLCIVAANVAGLLLVRALSQQPAQCLRSALGASRVRLVRSAMTEAMLLAAGGAAAGYLFARASLPLLLAEGTGALPRLHEIALGGRSLVFTALISLLVALVIGFISARSVSRGSLSAMLAARGRVGGGGSRAQNRLRLGLVISEVALAMVLLVGAGLLFRSFVELVRVDPGFDAEHVVVANLQLSYYEFGDMEKPGDAVRGYYQRLLDRLRAHPEIIAAGGTTALPMSSVGSDFDRPFWREGEKPDAGAVSEVRIRMVTPDYFRTMGIEVVRGRPIGAQDIGRFRDLERKVTVVNEAVANHLWPRENPIGKRLMLDYQYGQYPVEVVGVVRNTRFDGLRRGPTRELYLPHAQISYPNLSIVAKTRGASENFPAVMRALVLDVDRSQPAWGITPMKALVSDSIARDQLMTALVGFMAIVALCLASIGLYGLLAYGVRQRRRELGVRMALGAGRGSVAWMVLIQSVRLTAIGLVLGAALAYGSIKWLGALWADVLFGVQSTDFVTYLLVVLVVVITSCLASFLPARLAATTDIVDTLRSD